MRRWDRVSIPRLHCGSCGKPFSIGDPICLIGEAQLRRCINYVGPAPASLPPLEMPSFDPDATQPTVIRSGKPGKPELPFNGKAAAAGND